MNPPIPSNEANLTPWTKSNFLAVRAIQDLSLTSKGGFKALPLKENS
jgi:hypothetical protein